MGWKAEIKRAPSCSGRSAVHRGEPASARDKLDHRTWLRALVFWIRLALCLVTRGRFASPARLALRDFELLGDASRGGPWGGSAAPLPSASVPCRRQVSARDALVVAYACDVPLRADEFPGRPGPGTATTCPTAGEPWTIRLGPFTVWLGRGPAWKKATARGDAQGKNGSAGRLSLQGIRTRPRSQ